MAEESRWKRLGTEAPVGAQKLDIEEVVPVSHPLVADLLVAVTAEGD